MLAPTLDFYSTTSFAIAFLASATGSLHCMGMCGPLRLLTGTSASSSMKYQAGRLSAYLLLGAGAGAIGWALPPWVPLLAIAIGVSISLSSIRLPKIFPGFRQKALLLASAKPWLLGLVSGILPCGLLHGWLGAAAAMGNPLQGAILLSILWLGTVPALEASSRIFLKPLNMLRKQFPKLVPLVLLLLVLIPIGIRMGWNAPLPANAQVGHCHEPANEKN